MYPVRRTALAALSALALAGCHAVRYDAGRAPSARRWEKTIHFWAWGFKGDNRVDLDAACPEGVASFYSEAGVGGWIAQVITLGFWSPRKAVVVCADGPRATGPAAGGTP
jgi:hypothetical protein